MRWPLGQVVRLRRNIFESSAGRSVPTVFAWLTITTKLSCACARPGAKQMSAAARRRFMRVDSSERELGAELKQVCHRPQLTGADDAAKVFGPRHGKPV